MSTAFTRALLDAAAAPYLSAGHFAWHFARGKLAGDPAFLALLERGLIPDNARILDLGCGQGLLASWLLSARALFEAGHWPTQWPAAPKPMAYRGVELMPRDVRRARRALGGRAEFVLGDLRTADFGKSDAVVILDALHYLDYCAQDDVLSRVRDTLVPAGVLLMRAGDATGGLPFRISNWVDHLMAFTRGHRLSRLYCRSLQDWQALLRQLSFAVESVPMSQGTPFANVLLVGRLGPSPSTRLTP
ncbi:MAG: class I SAM-dependent methyltransferase [Gammaproteobacteria bacterium]